jgi:hypothetical protein
LSPTPPEEQRRSLAEAAKFTRSPSGETSLSTAVLAENLALSELAEEFGTPVIRHVSLSGDVDIGFDGATFRRRELIAFQVKYLVSPISREVVRQVMDDAVRVGGESAARIATLILAIVSPPEVIADQKAATESLRSLVEGAAVPMEFRVFDFVELKRKYGINGG